MNVIFYRFSGERELVDKTNFLSNSVTLQCNLKENTSIINPSILISISSITNITEYNYCYIEMLGRYYFIDDVVIEANNLIRFSLSVDVLMSYKTFLFGQKALISRNQYLSSEDLNGGFQIDKRMQFNNHYDVEVNDIGTVFFGVSSLPVEPTWYCLTYFGPAPWFPVGGPIAINPYGTFSNTVLIKTDASNGKDQLLSKIISGIYSDYEGVTSYVCSMFSIPFDCSPFVMSVIDTLKIGNISIDVSSRQRYGEYVYHIKPKSMLDRFTANIGNISNYLDITPYTEYKIHLPFIGLMDIPIESFDNVNNKFTIFIDTIFDFTIGTVTYRLMYEKSNQLITFNEVSAECMNPIPVSSTNASSISRAKDAYLASFIGETVSASITSVAGLAIGLVTENYALAVMSAVSGASKIISGGIKANYDLKKMVPTGHSQKSSSIYSSFNLYVEDTDPKVVNSKISVIKFIRRPLNDNEDYYRLNGHLCYMIKELSEVYGYTEISDIHLEIPSILTEESDMLMSLLTNGVIFPNPPT